MNILFSLFACEMLSPRVLGFLATHLVSSSDSGYTDATAGLYSLNAYVWKIFCNVAAYLRLKGQNISFL